MELTVYHDGENKIVIAEPVAKATTENIRFTAFKTLEFSQKYQCNRLLFDIRKCPEGQSIMQGFQAMHDMERTTGLTLKHKCAIVYNPEIYSNERATFIENVVVNRPNPIFRMFNNRADAIAWLNK